MSSVTKATTENNIIFLTEENEISETVTTSITTSVTTTDSSGNIENDIQTVTISITSTQD